MNKNYKLQITNHKQVPNNKFQITNKKHSHELKDTHAYSVVKKKMIQL
jgi:hypothetical protein